MKTTRYHGFRRIYWLCLVCVPLMVAGPVAAQSAQGAQSPQASTGTQSSTQKTFSNQQLDQMLAPVALYPDALLSQVLMASTYPGNVADAAAWSAAHPKTTGDDAVKQVANTAWDPSVQSLVAFPQVLAQMKQQPEWVQNMGDAFLAQPDDVMASVQRLRAQAQKAGNLKTTEQQKVVVQQAPATAAAPSTTVIQIEPANPEVVYVPSYNPQVVYGTWAYPSYPPYYWPPPPGYAYPVASGLAAGIAFGVGVAAVNCMWGGFNWGHGDVDINVNRYNNINNVNNRISGNGNSRQNWNHNPSNRRGTPYRDQGSRERYGQGVGGANQREAFRGNDANRQRALQSFDRSTGNGSSMAARRGAGETGAALNRPSGGNRAGGGQGAAGGADRGNLGGQGRGDLGGQTRERGNAGGQDRGNLGGGQQHGNFGGDRASQGPRNNAFSGGQSPGSAHSQMNRGQASQRSMSQSRGAGGGAGRQMSRPAPARAGGGGRRR
jgi:hypothetical protein